VPGRVIRWQLDHRDTDRPRRRRRGGCWTHRPDRARTIEQVMDIAACEAFELTETAITTDDFGSGWSTLSRTRDLPIDLVKINQALISELGCHLGPIQL